jgi:hypothetical protein
MRGHLRLQQQVFRKGSQGKSSQPKENKMYYRLEPELDYFLIKHVESDREVGYAFYTHCILADGSNFDLCEVYNNAHLNLASVPSTLVEFPIRCAAVSAAAHDEHQNYPGLAVANGRADRMERRLGVLLADTASVFCRALNETIANRPIASLAEQLSQLIVELAKLWRASRVGSLSYNAGRGTEEPYFANPLASGPRLTFSGAAQAYGMRELRARYPNIITDAERQKLLGWVLQWLSDALLNEREEEKKERDRIAAEIMDQQKRYASTRVRKVRRCHKN